MQHLATDLADKQRPIARRSEYLPVIQVEPQQIAPTRESSIDTCPLPIGNAPDVGDGALTIADLLAWDQTPVQVADLTLSSDVLTRAMTWPHLWDGTEPSPAPGTLLLLTAQTLDRQRPLLANFFTALARAAVAAVIIPAEVTIEAGPSPLPILRTNHTIDHHFERAILRRFYERRQQLGQRRLALEQALTDSALRGDQPDALIAIGAAHLDRTIYRLDDNGTVVSLHSPQQNGGTDQALPPILSLPVDQRPVLYLHDQSGGRTWLLARTYSGDSTSGVNWLALDDTQRSLDDGDRDLLMRLATALTLTGQRQATGGRGQRIASLLHAADDPGLQIARARSLGIDPDGYFAVVRLSRSDGTAMPWALIRTILAAATGGELRGETIADADNTPIGLLLHLPGGDDFALRAAQKALAQALATQPIRLYGTISHRQRGLHHLPDCAKQAEFGLALLRAGLIERQFLDWDNNAQLGPYRPLYPLWGQTTTSEFVWEVFGPLLQREAQQIHELLRSLLVYLRHGCNAGGAATELAVHRNTVTYRIRQIEQLTGLSAYNPAHLPTLFLAALLWSLPEPPGKVDPKSW